MKENLRTTHFADGTPIPAGGAKHSDTAPYYYDYSSSSIPLDERGYLYNWPAAMHGAASSNANPSGVQGVCPTGWHLPSEAEWEELEESQYTHNELEKRDRMRSITNFLGENAGKLAGGDKWCNSSNDNAPGNIINRNASGFTAVPAGACNMLSFSEADSSAYFWSSSIRNSVDGIVGVGRYLSYRMPSMLNLEGDKKCGFSVRCIRDAGDMDSKNTNNDGQPCQKTSTVTDKDGNIYNTVQIGLQCWMKENLRTTHFADGTPIPVGDDYSSKEPFYYDNSKSVIPLAERGYLYNWSATMHGDASSGDNPSNVQGICPTGWHVPSEAEWAQLTEYVGHQRNCICNNNSDFVAKALASTSNWDTKTNDKYFCQTGYKQSANNATGFTAVPAGVFDSGWFMYKYASDIAFFWASTENNKQSVRCRTVESDGEEVGGGNIPKSWGASVRCLRD